MKTQLLAGILCSTLACLPLASSRAQQAATAPSASSAEGAQSAPGLPPAKIAQIDAAIAAWLTLRKAPALSVAIVTENQLRFAKGYGLADLENAVPAKADTAYRLASLAKSLTAVAVMQLVERGKLELDAPVRRYCAVWPEKQSLQNAPEKQFTITVRQLLTHFAGLRHYKPNQPLNTRYFATLNEAVSAFKDDPLVVEPETQYSYSTPGYTLLGCAIEGASGQSYLAYLSENVLLPAGMKRTFPDNVYAIIPNRARGYGKSAAGMVHNAPLHDTSEKIPAGGLVTTVEDLARFAIALNTGKLVKAETLAAMWTKPKTRDGKESNYAFGFLVGVGKFGQQRIFNDGSQPGTRSYLSLLPKLGYAVALMTNLEGAFCEELLPQITDIILDTPPAQPPKEK